MNNCYCSSHRRNRPVQGKYECIAFVRGNVAYALDALPQTHVELTTGAPWAQATIYLCGTHHTQFIKARPIGIINIPSKEDTTMNTTYTTNHMFTNITLDALIDRASNLFAEQAEYVRDIFGDIDQDEDYPEWFKNYTARLNRLNCVLDNRQFIEFWMKNPIFPNISKEETMKEEKFCSMCGGLGEDRYENPCSSCGGDGCYRGEMDVDWHPECELHGDECETPGGCQYVQFPTMKEVIAWCKANDFTGKIPAKVDGMITIILNADDKKTTPLYTNTSKEDTMNINTIITNNEEKENNLPSSTVTGSSDRGDKWIKCVKCSKEIGSNWYHANVADLRTCAGAAPAPVKRVYKTDVLTGETVLTNSNLRFFYDSSKAVVFAKSQELRKAGVHVIKVAKATKGNQDWYVEYKI